MLGQQDSLLSSLSSSDSLPTTGPTLESRRSSTFPLWRRLRYALDTAAASSLQMPTMVTYISVDLASDVQKYPQFLKSTAEEIHYAVSRYEKFLKLAAKYKNERLAPTLDIDLVWHAHMLHPVSYARDSQNLFGYILDHDGGFGEKPPS